MIEFEGSMYPSRIAADYSYCPKCKRIVACDWWDGNSYYSDVNENEYKILIKKYASSIRLARVKFKKETR